jgi:hypothetical protein
MKGAPKEVFLISDFVAVNGTKVEVWAKRGKWSKPHTSNGHGQSNKHQLYGFYVEFFINRIGEFGVKNNQSKANKYVDVWKAVYFTLKLTIKSPDS